MLKLTDIYTLVIIHIDRYQCFGAEVLELNMNKNYEIHSGKLKALSDTNRLMIIDMLSCGELCACEILESSISRNQPYHIIWKSYVNVV